MDLSFSAEELAFRDEVRAFIAANVPADTRRKVLEGLEVSRDDTLRWQQILHRQGWGGPNWPMIRVSRRRSSAGRTAMR